MGKVVILRDIDTINTHTGHLRILHDLSKHNATNYKELHKKWLEVLDVNILNKRFFKELSNWYFWAMRNVRFPDDKEKNEEVRNAVNLIRLITRIIFVWFIKEKGLVSEKLFNTEDLKFLVKDFNSGKQSHNYYNAILQNLFFGTLNQKMTDRKFTKEGSYLENINEHGIYNLYRYAELFVILENDILKLFAKIPFLNGGLFDCLDKSFKDDNGKNHSLYIDGFSRNVKKRAIVPDFLFFDAEQDVDLNSIYDTKGKTYKTKGLINILNSYKFTIAENTPQEEDVALDPELLGKVFENLLANYNPETKTTARKQTGSFYTPREIVDYMVDESLVAYLKSYFLEENIEDKQVAMFRNEVKEEQLRIGKNINQLAEKEKELEKNLHLLLDYSGYSIANPFDKNDTKMIIKAIDNCKILDPACGSGAFPMGILHKMVYMLQKLDPENKQWRLLQEEKLGKELKEAAHIQIKQERDARLLEISDIFEHNASDYGRKLYLIENCIFGADIQPIAVQIAKLRFFISLIVDQKTNETKENYGIRALPNLETKFVAADTLIGLEKEESSLFHTPEIKNKENQIKQVRHDYFTANNRHKKLILQTKDRQLRAELADDLKSLGYSTKNANNIAGLNLFDQNAHVKWFDPEWMFGLTQGFDIVIGNPPYVQLQNNGGELANLYEKCEYSTFTRKGDICCLFYERGYQLLKQSGHLCFITSNKWMRTDYGKNIRKFFTENTNPIQLIDFAGVKVFESATVDVNILMFSKDKNQQKTKACIVKKEDIKDLGVYFMQNASEYSFSTSGSWVILSPIEQQIKAKIEAVGTPLRDWDIQINYGIKTGLNEAFIISEEKRKELIEQDPKSADIIRPILRGRDIKRYGYEFAD
ncbi:MAG: Eco57I restriction-modification methylase domain-containing protein, partial [Campylobacteraceae bacterium]|nr:Eco57I restriction-modification methylase domain-containing protein [Campylobacteraceae bacterium]